MNNEARSPLLVLLGDGVEHELRTLDCLAHLSQLSQAICQKRSTTHKQLQIVDERTAVIESSLPEKYLQMNHKRLQIAYERTVHYAALHTLHCVNAAG